MKQKYTVPKSQTVDRCRYIDVDISRVRSTVYRKVLSAVLDFRIYIQDVVLASLFVRQKNLAVIVPVIDLFDLRVMEFGDHRAWSISISTRNSIDCKNIWGGKVHILGFVKNPTKLFDFLLGPVLALLVSIYEYCWFWLAKVITDCAATAHCFSLSLSDLNSLACELNFSVRVITSSNSK